MALKGRWGRAAPEAEACRRGLPWPSAQSMFLQQPSALSFKPATDRPAHLVMSAQGHGAVKAAIYTLAHNNHSPGRNGTLEGGNRLAGSSDHLQCPRLSTASAAAPLLRGMAAERGGRGQGPWSWQVPWVMGAGCLSKAQASAPALLTQCYPISGEPAEAGDTSVALRHLAKRRAHSRHPVMPCC